MNKYNQNTTIDHIFRHEYGKIISILIHKFGPQNLEKIEDVVQDAFLKAMQVWGYKEVPKNPTAWLLQVAKNTLIDSLRRDQKMQQKDDVLDFLENSSNQQEEISLNNMIQDSQLKMTFACCNPKLSSESQIILSLKLIGGFSNKEISKALLKKEDTIAKSFTRAKKKFKETIKTLDIPVEMALSSRINIVLKVIYLLFSEGYTTSYGEEIIKRDICYEAIRLALLLTDNSSTNTSETNALIALMCFHASRFDARTDENGNFVDLEHHNRSKYNRELIRVGMIHFKTAEKKPSQNPSYFLQAAVSYSYCEAESFDKIQWKNILNLYDLQLKYSYSPIIRLNRIIPFYKVYGAKKAIKALEDVYLDSDLEESGLYYSIKAQLLIDLSQKSAAVETLNKAIEHTTNDVQKKHLKKKLIQIK
ncbi:sigma-70 family RNA polymerase sigma factor [Pseudotenacibaculum sp. MALMAid0570]|uniref:RNA polymerase sigma factor n=1 Tax=Pseudotenacibaculum sp. MALMAid0570 TaxID=3143938 RepID=UPI0032DE43EF